MPASGTRARAAHAPASSSTRATKTQTLGTWMARPMVTKRWRTAVCRTARTCQHARTHAHTNTRARAKRGCVCRLAFSVLGGVQIQPQRRQVRAHGQRRVVAVCAPNDAQQLQQPKLCVRSPLRCLVARAAAFAAISPLCRGCRRLGARQGGEVLVLDGELGGVGACCSVWQCGSAAVRQRQPARRRGACRGQGAARGGKAPRWTASNGPASPASAGAGAIAWATMACKCDAGCAGALPLQSQT